MLCLLALLAKAQDRALPSSVGIKWSPAGLLVGSISLQGEYNFGKNSLTAKIGIPVNTKHTLEYDDRDAHFGLKSTSFLAGYRTYLSRRHMKGLYLEPFFSYVHQSSEGQGTATITGDNVVMDFRNEYNAFGLGAQLGAQFLIRKKFVIDVFFLGPMINSATNHFSATETSSAIPWNYVQAEEVEADIRDFLDEFPFIRKRTTVMVDSESKTVKADFRGGLPGLRIGVSFGFVF